MQDGVQARAGLWFTSQHPLPSGVPRKRCSESGSSSTKRHRWGKRTPPPTLLVGVQTGMTAVGDGVEGPQNAAKGATM